MAKFELKLPKMGESVAEATITSWLKDVGDTIDMDDPVLEIATDKVDSEVPSEVEGVLVERLFNVDDVVQVGQVLAIIETKGDDDSTSDSGKESSVEAEENEKKVVQQLEQTITKAKETVTAVVSSGDRFYSPLVKNIAKAEGISKAELDDITGTGKDGRVTKNDILDYIQNRGNTQQSVTPKVETSVVSAKIIEKPKAEKPVVISSGGDEIIEMTRMGKLIAHHMVESVQTAAHVQSFIEADVTNIWNRRKKVKDGFMKREGENLHSLQFLWKQLPRHFAIFR